MVLLFYWNKLGSPASVCHLCEDQSYPNPHPNANSKLTPCFFVFVISFFTTILWGLGIRVLLTLIFNCIFLIAIFVSFGDQTKVRLKLCVHRLFHAIPSATVPALCHLANPFSLFKSQMSSSLGILLIPLAPTLPLGLQPHSVFSTYQSTWYMLEKLCL